MHPEISILKPVTNYIKIYPNHAKLVLYKRPHSVIPEGYELTTKKQTKQTDSINPTAFIDSLRRSKTNISDIVLSNDFEIFITFTFSKDRQNIKKLKQQITDWIRNQKKIHGNFDYILVPEFHKDGKSIHFHGLFKGYKGKLVLAKKQINNRTTYNIKSYRLGFSTAVVIDNNEKVSSYIKKYITKDMPRIKNKKRYWVSHGVKRPTIIHNINLEMFNIDILSQEYSNDVLTIFKISDTLQVQQLSEV